MSKSESGHWRAVWCGERRVEEGNQGAGSGCLPIHVSVYSLTRKKLDVRSVDVEFFSMGELAIVEINQGCVFAFRHKDSD
jgi:hypothetical protein